MDEETPRTTSGCGPRLAAVLIVFFVNVPLVSVGWGRLWRTAPILLAVALLVDVFLVLLVALWWWRRRHPAPGGTSVPH
jgi:hypothetical protein